MSQTQVLMLVARKVSGIDCTEDESADIKRYFDTHDVSDPVTSDLATEYPLEYAEWADETERGLRS